MREHSLRSSGVLSFLGTDNPQLFYATLHESEDCGQL